MDIDIAAALIGAGAGIVGAVVGGLITVLQTRETLSKQHATELSVERAITRFLTPRPGMKYRSFQMIKHHIGGFEPNELRKLLVRSGAVRFMAADGSEMWALLSEVEDEFSMGRGKLMQSPMNIQTDEDRFPGAFNDAKQY